MVSLSSNILNLTPPPLLTSPHATALNKLVKILDKITFTVLIIKGCSVDFKKGAVDGFGAFSGIVVVERGVVFNRMGVKDGKGVVVTGLVTIFFPKSPSNLSRPLG